jgi:hypothetical protein
LPVNCVRGSSGQGTGPRIQLLVMLSQSGKDAPK